MLVQNPLVEEEAAVGSPLSKGHSNDNVESLVSEGLIILDELLFLVLSQNTEKSSLLGCNEVRKLLILLVGLIKWKNMLYGDFRSRVPLDRGVGVRVILQFDVLERVVETLDGNIF